MRIMGRNHKPYFVQIAEFYHVIGNNQVPNVNGIESAEIESYFFGC